MKNRWFSLSLFILLCSSGMAQGDFSQTLLVEHFTNSHCPVCASQNPGFYETLDEYPGSFIHIAYHPPVPYEECIFYQYNPTENEARFNQYGLFGTPSVVFNGDETYSAGQVDQEDLMPYLEQTAEVALEVELSKEIPYEVEVTIRSQTTFDPSDYSLFVLLAEELVEQTTSNGEEMHPNVFRRFLSPSDGSTLNISPGEPKTMTFSYDWDDTWEEDELYAAAFIQNKLTGEVINASSSILNPTAIEDVSALDKIEIYPSPADEYIQIKTQRTRGELIIYDVSGQYQFKTIIDRTAQIVDVSRLEAGVYMVYYITDSGRYYNSFVKE